MNKPLIERCDVKLCPDASRTVLRPFHLVDPTEGGDPNGRTSRVIRRLLALEPAASEAELAAASTALKSRHRETDDVLDRRFADLASRFSKGLVADDRQARLIALFFSEEYSIEAAALFNPSVVPHFDQSGLDDGDTRLILSMRGIGEGHISSLIFQTGVWHADGTLSFDPRGALATGPTTILPDPDGPRRTAELTFPDVPIGDRVIYPFLPSQGRGIEDARFCRFVEDDGDVDYRCTFTAFDGTDHRQSVLRTRDFRSFTGRRLDGDAAFRKGAAWFPRRIGGRYLMLGRLDDESVSLMWSDDADDWHAGETTIRPQFPWEFVQMGNCGSPIEIDEGWLVLTHGVGRARRYCMGAALLDRDDPSRLLARTPFPFLEPQEDERGGYVPNVVYSCGAIVRDRTLLLPYGVADDHTAFGTLDLDCLLAALT